MRRLWPAALVIAVVAGLAAPASAQAVEFAVDRTDDTLAGYDACTPAPNDCTLRGALKDADNTTGTDLVSLPAGVFRRDPANMNEIEVLQPVAIAGVGARATVIEGAKDTPTLRFSKQPAQMPPNTAEIRDVTITKGDAYFAGGIFSEETNLSLNRVNVSGNTAPGVPMFGSFGGGISFRGPVGRTLTIENSTISGNRSGGGAAAVTRGAGVDVFGGSATIRTSTIAGNVGDGQGKSVLGAGLAASGGSIALDRVTVAGNRAEDVGAGQAAGNLWQDAGLTITAARSIVADGTGPGGENCLVPITSQGANVEDRNQCGLGAADRRNASVGLGPLANNGGPTNTRAITRTSAALDFAGDCRFGDQRGLPPAFAACDSGAFELQPTAPGGGGTGGGGITPSPTTGQADTTDPIVELLRLSRKRFRSARRGRAIVPRSRRLGRGVGTRIRYDLSEDAKVKLAIEKARRAKGRLVGGKCVKRTRLNRSRRKCTRFRTLRGRITDRGESGTNRLRFTGRLRGRRLGRGLYRLVLKATDSSNNVSKRKRVRFRVLRR